MAARRHAVDDQSFSLEGLAQAAGLPQMSATGAFGPRMVYTADDVDA
jgi:hypothetical protein